MVIKDYEKLFAKENVNFDSFKSEKIRTDVFEPSKGRKEIFYEQVEMLEKEFSQCSYLEFYCVWLIVKIRRKIDLENSIESFFVLLNREKDFLIQNLSSRWLVSICDTYIDYSQSKEEIGYAFGSVLLLNTIKLYETEYKMHHLNLTSEDILNLGPETQLFDGMTAYDARGGDMLINMMNRVEEKMNQDLVTAQIYKELIMRCSRMDTVFSRMQEYRKVLNFKVM